MIVPTVFASKLIQSKDDPNIWYTFEHLLGASTAFYLELGRQCRVYMQIDRAFNDRGVRCYEFSPAAASVFLTDLQRNVRVRAYVSSAAVQCKKCESCSCKKSAQEGTSEWTH